ncbi:MAG: putative toxin-antitoxin system toxin component, PIN family [Thermoleophilia bacterium]
MYPKVVLDTNVLVSALNFGGKPRAIMAYAHGKSKRFDLFLSPFILNELSRTLSGEKFLWSVPKIERATQLLVKWGDVVSTRKSISAIPQDRDDDDNRILECAVKAEADLIVSGDSDLLDLKQYEGIKIMKPAQFLRILEQ